MIPVRNQMRRRVTRTNVLIPFQQFLYSFHTLLQYYPCCTQIVILMCKLFLTKTLGGRLLGTSAGNPGAILLVSIITLNFFLWFVASILNAVRPRSRYIWHLTGWEFSYCYGLCLDVLLKTHAVIVGAFSEVAAPRVWDTRIAS